LFDEQSCDSVCGSLIWSVLLSNLFYYRDPTIVESTKLRVCHYTAAGSWKPDTHHCWWYVFIIYETCWDDGSNNHPDNGDIDDDDI